MSASDLPSFAEPVGLFPLPNVVLFPGMILALQVYEPRYRAMVRDALTDQGVIAMALLQPDYEAYYYTNRAQIHPVVCVGRLREHVQVPDGRYFVNLLGLCRARVRQEDRDGEYRLAMLDPMIVPDSGIEQDGEYAARQSLRRLVNSPVFDGIDDIDKFRAYAYSEWPLGSIVDMIAAGLLPADAVEIKQRILEEMNMVRRAETLQRELHTLGRMFEMRQHSQGVWPHLESAN